MVKLLSSYINFTIGTYIIEPVRKLKKWVEPFVRMDHVLDIKYIYRGIYKKYGYNININNNIYYSSLMNLQLLGNTMLSKIILKNISPTIIYKYLSLNPSRWAYNLLKNNFDKIDRWCL
jgi:hypothetical protein